MKIAFQGFRINFLHCFFHVLLFFDIINIDDNMLKAVDARNVCCVTDQPYFTEILYNDNLETFDTIDDWVFICSKIEDKFCFYIRWNFLFDYE
jgi:hypothetical protein